MGEVGPTCSRDPQAGVRVVIGGGNKRGKLVGAHGGEVCG